MTNSEIAEKIAQFLNSLTIEEIVAFRKFLISRKYHEFIIKRLNNEKI